jgi:hypothetical protein
MKWNQPRLTWKLDCEPLGCPGLTITFWLNADTDLVNVPSWANIEEEDKRRKAAAKAPDWDNWFYYQVVHSVECIEVPAAYLEGAETDQRITFSNPQEVWEFEHEAGFDPQILQWGLRQYANQRQERLKAASKN